MASRIETFTVGGQILISEGTFARVSGDVRIRGDLRVDPKGAKEPIRIYDVCGYAGREDLTLETDAAEWRSLKEPLPIWYTPLDGKSVDRTVFTASVLKARDREAWIEMSRPVDRLTNLRFQWETPEAHPEAEHGYGKIVDEADVPTQRVLRFTSIPDSFRERLERL